MLAVVGYNAAYWLVIATSRLTGAKIVSLSVSEFFTYQIAVALMFLFCGCCVYAIALWESKLKIKLSALQRYSMACASVFASAAVCIVIRFFMLKMSAAAQEGEQAFLFLSAFNYASWGSLGALFALSVFAVRYTVISRKTII